MMRRMACAVALSVLAGKAGAQWRDIDVRLRGYDGTVRLDPRAVWTKVAAAPDETYAAARTVFEQIKMPLTAWDSTHRVMYQKGINTTRTIMGNRMSWALTCGQGFSGDNADSYRINMAYAVFIEPTVDNQSRLGIALVAGAQSLEGAFKPAFPCGSTGLFESHIAMRVKAQVQLK
jgi:hypothetical protein